MRNKTIDDGASGLPRRLRYEIANDLIVRIIAEKKLNPGDKLPSVADLVAMSGVSLISVRRALSDLENTGRIYRHQGVGTFVAGERVVSEPNRSGEFLQTLTVGSDPAELTTELLSITIGLPSETVARMLSIGINQQVWEVTRLRKLGAQPAILEKAVLPLSLVPSLDEPGLRAGASMYNFLAGKYDLVDERTEQVFEVSLPRADERAILGLARKVHMVRIRGVSFNAAGVPFDCWQQTYRASSFVFYLAGGSDRRLLRSDLANDWTVRPLRSAGAVVENGRDPARQD